ncbi:MAG: phosphodiester glycosidase family protein [Candidatus Sericytochromatia bacterium]|nr:phosphodiester glycosidase family protein [Candidatus Sericytochromatia bacterium]
MGLVIVAWPAASAGSPIGLLRTTVLGVPVTVATVALDAPGLSVSLETARGGAGRAETLETFGRRLPYASVAVPGAFFSMINQRPVGNLVTDFHVLNQAPRAQRGTTLVFDARNEASIIPGLEIRLGYQINDGLAFWERPAYNLLHGLNSPLPRDGDSLKGFNRFYTDRQVHLGRAKAVVVEGERVTRLLSGGIADIPPYGFVIAGQGTSADKIARLKPGTWLNVQPLTVPVIPGRLRTAIGAGPTLLRQGKVQSDWRGEGFRDPAVAGRTNRVVVGLVSPNRLKLILIQGAVDLAGAGLIARALGCTEAMNFDGGSSSGMWAYGQLMQAPGRSLTNVLAFSMPGTVRPATTASPVTPR